MHLSRGNYLGYTLCRYFVVMASGFIVCVVIAGRNIQHISRTLRFIPDIPATHSLLRHRIVSEFLEVPGRILDATFADVSPMFSFLPWHFSR